MNEINKKVLLLAIYKKEDESLTDVIKKWIIQKSFL